MTKALFEGRDSLFSDYKDARRAIIPALPYQSTTPSIRIGGKIDHQGGLDIQRLVQSINEMYIHVRELQRIIRSQEAHEFCCGQTAILKILLFSRHDTLNNLSIHILRSWKYGSDLRSCVRCTIDTWKCVLNISVSRY